MRGRVSVRRRVAVGLLASAALVWPALSAAAVPAPDYEMPFPCGQAWTGTTRSSHSPSPYAVDFNRPDDLGDIMTSSAPGMVTRVADLGGTSYGKYVIVDHGGGNTTLYAHLQAFWVNQGQRVDQGTVLGLVGESGGVTGPHLHFEERLNGTDIKPWFHQTLFVFGTTQTSVSCPDVPLAGDWNDDAKDEVAVFRHGAKGGVFRLYVAGSTPQVVQYGENYDLPVTGDWNGDGRTDVGVRRQATTTFLLRRPDGSTTGIVMGRIKDRPVTGDWDGDGTTEVGLWRPGAAKFLMRSKSGVVTSVLLGTVGSEPITGDWDGDKDTDLGVWDAATATFTLRSVKADGTVSLSRFVFGTSTDLPVTGDWNGDGVTDVGTWSPSTATFSLRTTGTATTAASITTKRFGRYR